MSINFFTHEEMFNARRNSTDRGITMPLLLLLEDNLSVFISTFSGLYFLGFFSRGDLCVTESALMECTPLWSWASKLSVRLWLMIVMVVNAKTGRTMFTCIVTEISAYLAWNKMWHCFHDSLWNFPQFTLHNESLNSHWKRFFLHKINAIKCHFCVLLSR